MLQDNVIIRYGMGITWQYYYKTNFGTVGSVSRNSVSVPRVSTVGGTVVLTRTLVHNLQGETGTGLASPWVIEDNVIDMTAYPPATGITIESVFNDLQLYTIRNNNITGGDRGYVLSQDPFQGNTEGPGLIQGGIITGVTTGIIATYRAEGNYNASNRWIIDGVTFLNNGVAVNATVPNVPSGYTKTIDIVIQFSTISGGTLGISNTGRSGMTSITAYRNSIVGQSSFGYQNLIASTQNATCNYWGQVDGPGGNQILGIACAYLPEVSHTPNLQSLTAPCMKIYAWHFKFSKAYYIDFRKR